MRTIRRTLLDMVLVLSAVACTGSRPDAGAATPGLTLVVLGDSLTKPLGTGSEQDWLQWADPERRFGLLANAGVAGERSDEILARVDRDVIRREPAWVTVLAGTNDIGQDVGAERIIVNLTRIYDALDAAGVRFVAITVPPMVMLTPEQVAAHRAVNTWIRERVEADWAGAVVGDWSAALSANGDGTSPIPEFFPDGVHFSGAGARAAGTALAPTFAALEPQPAE